MISFNKNIIKDWEKVFCLSNQRKPTREDLKNAPLDIREAYTRYYFDKKDKQSKLITSNKTKFVPSLSKEWNQIPKNILTSYLRRKEEEKENILLKTFSQKLKTFSKNKSIESKEKTECIILSNRSSSSQPNPIPERSFTRHPSYDSIPSNGNNGCRRPDLSGDDNKKRIAANKNDSDTRLYQEYENIYVDHKGAAASFLKSPSTCLDTYLGDGTNTSGGSRKLNNYYSRLGESLSDNETDRDYLTADPQPFEMFSENLGMNEGSEKGKVAVKNGKSKKKKKDKVEPCEQRIHNRENMVLLDVLTLHQTNPTSSSIHRSPWPVRQASPELFNLDEEWNSAGRAGEEDDEILATLLQKSKLPLGRPSNNSKIDPQPQAKSNNDDNSDDSSFHDDNEGLTGDSKVGITYMDEEEAVIKLTRESHPEGGSVCHDLNTQRSRDMGSVGGEEAKCSVPKSRKKGRKMRENYQKINIARKRFCRGKMKDLNKGYKNWKKGRVK